MIEKFNFYDIYGYFLPGLTLLAILWLPFGLVAHVWPQDWSSAIVALALAYVLGHFLQTFGATGLKSRVAPNDRFPSDAALDRGAMPDEMRTKIADIFGQKLGLDLGIDQAVSPEIDAVRNQAFFLARSVLIKDKTQSYAEQYQGMYALTRGLMLAFAWGIAYWIGWAAGIFRTRPVVVVAVFVAAIAFSLLASFTVWLSRQAIATAQRWFMERASLFVLMPLSLLAVGYALGIRYRLTPIHCISFLLAAVGGLVACLRFYNAYKSFASSFAIAVWRDFLASNVFLADKSSHKT